MSDIYRSRVGPGTAAMPFASPAAFGAGLGEEMQRFGAERERTEDFARRKQEARDRELQAVEAGKALSSLGAGMDAFILEAKQTAGPGGAGHSEKVLAEFDSRQEKLLGGIANEHVRRQTALQLAEMRGRVESNGATFEAGSRAAKQAQDVEDHQNIAQNRLRLSGGDVAVLAEEFNSFETMVAGLNLPADKKDALLREGLGWREYSWAQSLDAGQRDRVLKSGKLEHLTARQLESLLSGTEVDLRRQEVEARRAEALEKAEAVEQINLAQKVVGDGGTLPAETWAELKGKAERFGLPLETYDLGKAELKSNLNSVWTSATPAQIDHRIKALDVEIRKAGDKVKPELTIERDHLATMLAARTAELKQDPLGYLARNGEAPVAIVWSDPATIQARLSQARKVSAATGAPVKPLTDEEAQELANLAASGASGRLDAINRVAAFGPGAALAVARQVAQGDAVFERAVLLPASYRQLAVNGVDVRKASPKLVPTTEVGLLFDDATGGAFRRIGGEFSVATIETAKNIFASLSHRNGQAEWDDRRSPALFKLAIHMALGGDRRDGVLRGGIGEWSGAKILLPVGMSQAEFDRKLSRAGGDAMVKAGNGVPVWEGGETIFTGDIRKHFVPVRVPDGRYRFERGNVVLTKADGEPWLLDVRKLP